MPIKSSFPLVADQIVAYNKNVLEILAKINSLSTTQEPSVEVRIFDLDGVLKTYNLPSFTYLKSEIERLNNSINSLYNIDSGGALIQTSSNNKFKKIITVDLNKEPNSINDIGLVTQFKSQVNWFFESMLNPSLFIELDLRDKVEDNVRKILSRRYIIEFANNPDGTFTTLGQGALDSFNTLYRGIGGIDIEEFENWYRTTPGVVNPIDPKYDEQMFDLEPNSVLYDGVFNVIRLEEDTLNRKLWYHVNSLDYIINDTGELRQLAIGSELIPNIQNASTRYKIVEISNTESNPRLRLERIEGLQPIPVGIGTLKIYSPVVFRKRARISIGYDERNVVFVKPMNADSNLISKNWSGGTGFYTNDLRSENGTTMGQYYTDFVYDYGEFLQDQVAKKIPNRLAGQPNIAQLDVNNFKVVQVNKHLTDNPDSNLMKTKHNYTVSLKSEITQIQEAIESRNKKIKATRFTSDSQKKQFEIELDELSKKKNSKSKLLESTNQEILSLSRSSSTKVSPKYRLRGFWDMPEAVAKRGTLPQEVVQFRVQYRYVSKDGREPSVETFKLTNESSKSKKQKTAAFSNWNEFKTDARKREYNLETLAYTWKVEDLENADTPNINQIDISISPNERVELRIKSISEVGWPESPVESEWSDAISIEFPDDLNNVLADNQFILEEASKEEVKVKVDSELTARGLDDHLSETIVLNNKSFYHTAESIMSGFKDENGVVLDLLQYLKNLEEKVKSLEEKISRAKGELEIVIIRSNNEFIISNNSETEFNIECEDYLEQFSGSGVPSGRVFANNIYVIKDFILKVKNKSVDSDLGLLSNRQYLSNTAIYSPSAPQAFWVNNQDELLFTDVSGISRTHLDNMFIWSVNYDTVTQTELSKLSENIGNSFTSLGSNSITNVLGLVEYNIGYSENLAMAFVSSNNSLLDSTKWIDSVVSVGSTTKLLSTIHPVTPDLQNFVETNEDKIKSIKGGDDNAIIIPLHIYFKMNALDNTQTGKDYEYIDLNKVTQTVKHIKKLRFFIEDENQNRPFTFTIKFTLNRAKVTFAARTKTYNTVSK